MSNSVAIGQSAGQISGPSPSPAPAYMPANPMMGGFDMNHMFQMYTTGVMMKMMNTMNDTSSGLFTYDKIIALIVLFLLNDIKKWVLEFIEFLKRSVTEHVPPLAQKAWGALYQSYERISYVFHGYMITPPPTFKEPCEHADECAEDIIPQRMITVELDLNTFNMNAIWQYMQMCPEERTKLGAKYPDDVCVNTLETITTNIVSKENISTGMTYKAITMQIAPDLTMTLNNIYMTVNNITGALAGTATDVAAAQSDIVVFDIENHEIFKSITGGDIKLTYPSGQTASLKQFICDKFKIYNDVKLPLLEYERCIIDLGYHTLRDYLFKLTNLTTCISQYTSNWFGIQIFRLIHMYLVDKNLHILTTNKERIFVLETYLLLFYIFEYFAHGGFQIIAYIIVDGNTNNMTVKTINDCGYTITFTIPLQKINEYIMYINPTLCKDPTIRPDFINSLERLLKNTTTTTAPPKPTKTTIALTTSDVTKTNSTMYAEFLDFYRTVLLKAPDASKSAQFSKSRDITVYAISYKKTEEVKIVENPEYAEWIEIFGGGAGGGKQSPPMTEKPDATVAAAGGTTPPAVMPVATAIATPYEMMAKMEAYRMKPPKTVEIRSQKSELICEKVNQLYKNMQSLYLREADKHKITSIVDKFKTRRDFYEQLGIPYKLGIMLYGHPGTGKSSTIKAVASTLEKDIYFVNLKNVRTNAELKGIFEHINEKCNGGVIVFEDMDASCEVIKRRGSGSGETRPDAVADVTDHVADDKLTLSYLLNLFDGTICRDGTIFAITTNHLENIDPALYRSGRVDVKIEFRKCDHYQVGQIFRHIIGRELAADVLAAIPEWTYSPADIIYEIMHYGLDDTVSDREIMSAFITKSAAGPL
jgi:hypothetical protein